MFKNKAPNNAYNGLVALNLQLITACMYNGLAYTSSLGKNPNKMELDFEISIPSTNQALYSHQVTHSDDPYVAAIFDQIEGKATCHISPPAMRNIGSTAIYYWRRHSVVGSDVAVFDEVGSRKPRVELFWIGFSKDHKELIRIIDGSPNPDWRIIDRFTTVNLYGLGTVVMVIPRRLPPDGVELTMGEESLKNSLNMVEERRRRQEEEATAESMSQHETAMSDLASAPATSQSQLLEVLPSQIALINAVDVAPMPAKSEYRFDFVPSRHLTDPMEAGSILNRRELLLNKRYLDEGQCDAYAALAEFGETDQAALAIIALSALTPSVENFLANNYKGVVFGELITVANTTVGIPKILRGNEFAGLSEENKNLYSRIIDLYKVLMAETPLPDNRGDVRLFLRGVLESDTYWPEYSSYLPLKEDSKIPKNLLLFGIEVLGYPYPLVKEIYGPSIADVKLFTIDINQELSIREFTEHVMKPQRSFEEIVDRMRNGDSIKDYVPADYRTILTVEEMKTLAGYMGIAFK